MGESAIVRDCRRIRRMGVMYKVGIIDYSVHVEEIGKVREKGGGREKVKKKREERKEEKKRKIGKEKGKWNK
jgi:hypothetical protein